jgi:phosphate transport system protein
MTSGTAPQPGKHTVRAFDEELNHLSGRIIYMGGLAEQLVADALDSLVQRDPDLASRVIQRDDELDRLEEEIDREVVRILATRQPLAVDLRMIVMALKISNDLERTGDYAVSIAKRARRLADHPRVLPTSLITEIGSTCVAMVKDVLDAYVERDTDKANEVWKRDEQVDSAYTSFFRELVTYMLEDPRKISTCIDLMFIAKNLERIGDHATNIAEKVIYMVRGAEINRPRHDAR